MVSCSRLDNSCDVTLGSRPQCSFLYRSYRGLEQRLGQDEPHLAKEGRCGIAADYGENTPGDTAEIRARNAAIEMKERNEVTEIRERIEVTEIREKNEVDGSDSGSDVGDSVLFGVQNYLLDIEDESD